MNDIAQKILIGVATSLGIALVVAFYRKVITPSVQFVRRFANLLDDVGLIRAEMITNGGKSLKDRVNDIGQTVTEIGNSLSLLEARQRGLIASLPRPTFEADSNLNWTEVNHSMERLTGLGLSQLVRKRWYSVIHDDDRSPVITELEHAIRDKRNVGISFRIVTDSGVVPVRLDAKPTFARASTESIICWTGWITRDEDRRVEERRVM